MRGLAATLFLAGLRAGLYRRLRAGPGGATRWAEVIGRRSRRPDGTRIERDEKTTAALAAATAYLHTEEGLAEWRAAGLPGDPPDHPDDLADLLRRAPTDREAKREFFNACREARGRIVDFLTD